MLDILRETAPPDGRAPPSLGAGPALAFKTGTSYGFRDAVAAGVGGGYVVAVWTGRPDGGGRPGMTGRAASLPLLFDTFDLLRADGEAPPAGELHQAPEALQRLAGEDDTPPRLLFPSNGASLHLDGFGDASRGVVLSATGDSDPLVRGRPAAVAGSSHPPDPMAAPGAGVLQARGGRRLRATSHRAGACAALDAYSRR